MSRKPFDYRTKVTILSGLIGVLSLTAVLGWAFSQQAVSQRQSQEPLLASFQTTAVAGLQIGADLVLKKAPTWALSFQGRTYPASADRVDTYLKTLSTQLRERLVTRDGDGQAFGLSKDFKTLKLLDASGKPLYELEVGGANDLGDKVYVRFSGQKEIWQTDRGFARTLDLDFNTWADLSAFPGRKDADLTRIRFDSRIELADKTVFAPFDLAKDTAAKTKWQDRLSKVSTEAMASWAALVPTFHAAAFAGPNDAAPGAAVGTLTLSWADGNTSTAVLHAPDAQSRYRLVVDGRDFWVNDWALNQLLYK